MIRGSSSRLHSGERNASSAVKAEPRSAGGFDENLAGSTVGQSGRTKSQSSSPRHEESNGNGGELTGVRHRRRRRRIRRRRRNPSTGGVISAAARPGEGGAGGEKIGRRCGDVNQAAAAQISPARRRSRSRGFAGGCAAERGEKEPGGRQGGGDDHRRRQRRSAAGGRRAGEGVSRARATAHGRGLGRRKGNWGGVNGLMG
jgi:hypothetical protein